MPNTLIPDASTLRKNCMEQIYTEVIAEIRALIGDILIYFQMNETIHSCGQYINLFV